MLLSEEWKSSNRQSRISLHHFSQCWLNKTLNIGKQWMQVNREKWLIALYVRAHVVDACNLSYVILGEFIHQLWWQSETSTLTLFVK